MQEQADGQKVRVALGETRRVGVLRTRTRRDVWMVTVQGGSFRLAFRNGTIGGEATRGFKVKPVARQVRGRTPDSFGFKQDEH